MAKDKEPRSEIDAKWCPLIGRQCIQGACMFWLGIWGKKGDGEPVLDEDCAFNWQVQLQTETLQETARTTAGQDKAANEVGKLTRLFAIGLRAGQDRQNAAQRDQAHLVD